MAQGLTFKPQTFNVQLILAHLILWVPGAQGVGQENSLEDAHRAPLAPLTLVILVVLVTLAVATRADPPV